MAFFRHRPRFQTGRRQAMAETHFELRCSQRNFSPLTISTILAHGAHVRDRKGTRVIVLNKDLRYLLADGLSEREARRVRGTMVILDSSGDPLTVYHASKQKLLNTKRINSAFHGEF